jgi:putative DNA primase/helicase
MAPTEPIERNTDQSSRVIAGSDQSPPERKTFPPTAEARPCYAVADEWVVGPGGKFRPGVWHFDGGKDDAELKHRWVCSPLHIDAVTFDDQDNNFGRLLRFRNTTGRWREWAMPMEFLRGSGEELRGELLAMGVEIDATSDARRHLTAYLLRNVPKRQVRCALQVGWCGDVFVLPDRIFSAKESDVIFQSGDRGHDAHTLGGTFDGWQAEIAARAVDNPVLMVTLSIAFAGPLLARCHADSGGIHLVGDSSSGKSSAVAGACSVWGGSNYIRSWRATANGMEGAALLFNDGLLALDEISEADPREIGGIIYALGNGRGKQRASRSGSARQVPRWRCTVLSSGERTVETTMKEGGGQAKAGQTARLPDMPVSRRIGAWDQLHGLPSGEAFSDAIKRAANTHFGHAGRAFLERLVHDGRDFPAMLEKIKSLPAFLTLGSDGQARRVATRMALVALAGELASDYGITGWTSGAAIAAASDLFRQWYAERGEGNDERRKIVAQVREFTEQHGDGRFSPVIGGAGIVVRERAGWWEDTSDGRVYWFTTSGMRQALAGFDFKRALAVLVEERMLPAPGANGERARTKRIADRAVKAYPILIAHAPDDDHVP